MLVIWLIAAVVLVVAELFTLDLVLIMFAVGALAAAGAGALGAVLTLQLLVFAAVATLGLAVARPALNRRLRRRSGPGGG